MDYNKESESLQVLHAESEKICIQNSSIDLDVSSWNTKNSSGLKTPEISTAYLRNISIKQNLSKHSSNPCKNSRKMRNLSPDLGKLADYHQSRMSSKKKSLPNHMINSNLTAKMQFNQKFISSNNESLGRNNEVPLKYTNYLNSSVIKRFKIKYSKNFEIKNKKLKLYIDKDTSLKIADILNYARSPTPDIKRFTPVLKNKISVYAAKTLEELLMNSKLPEIPPKKSKLKSN